MQDAGPGDAAQLERRVFASALALLLVCAWPFVGDIPARYLALTRALVEERGCAIDRFHEDTPDKAFKDGHYYLAAAPGPSFAAAPAYALVYFCGGSVLAGLIAATLFAGVLPGALAFRGLFRLTGVAARAPPPTPWRLATVLALAATFVTPLATVFYASALSVACVVWSLVHGCAYRRAVEGTPAAEGPSAEGPPPEADEAQPAAPSSASAPRAHMAWAGCLLASLVGCEYAAAPIALAVGGALALCAWRARRLADLVAFAGGAALPALLVAGYHSACFGAPWRTGYGFHANSGFAELLDKGVKGYQVPTPHTLYEVSVGWARGLLPFAPPVLLGALLAPRAARREPGLVALGLGLGGLYLLLNAARVSDWYAGFSWGPRYQAHAVVFWLLPLTALREPPRWAWRALWAAVALGGAVTALGLGIRWRATLDASLREAWTFGLQTKLTTLALTGDAFYYPRGLPEHTGAAVAWGLVSFAALFAAWALIWRLGRRGAGALAATWLGVALLSLLPWSTSMGRGPALREELKEREFLSFTLHYPTYANDVRAAEVALSLREPADAAWFARRALSADPEGELAQLVLALAEGDRPALERLAREAKSEVVRGRALARR